MMNTTKTASKAATKTEITGRDARSCTGRTIYNTKQQTFTVGQRVGFEWHTEATEGGHLTGWRYATIERIAAGTVSGMHGTSALVVVTVEGRQAIIPARELASA